MKKNISVGSNESFVNHTVLDGSNNEEMELGVGVGT